MSRYRLPTGATNRVDFFYTKSQNRYFPIVLLSTGRQIKHCKTVEMFKTQQYNV